MPTTNPSVDGYIRKDKTWQPTLQALREIVLETPLVEEIKWRAPCYTLGGKNVVMLGRLKDNCVLSFLKGALLKDPKKLLEPAGPNSQSACVARFTSVEQVATHAATLKAYIEEAIALEQAGMKVAFKKAQEFEICAELQAKLDADATFKAAFDALTPGRRRWYAVHFAEPKQSKTRVARIERAVEKIFDGKGLSDYDGK